MEKTDSPIPEAEEVHVLSMADFPPEGHYHCDCGKTYPDPTGSYPRVYVCDSCKKKIRDWAENTAARHTPDEYLEETTSMFPDNDWITGPGARFALAATCRNVTVSLWSDLAKARKKAKFINETGCGGLCCKNHAIIDLDDPVARNTIQHAIRHGCSPAVAILHLKNRARDLQ